MYQTILMDPPWNERGGGKIKRGADRHYPLMKVEAMPALILGARGSTGCCEYPTNDDETSDCACCGLDYRPGPSELVFRPAESCHLWMWVTNNYLADGLFLMRALAFRYVTNACWGKVKQDLAGLRTQIGLGQYLRGSHELLLFGVRGLMMKPPKARPSLILAERTKHSRKPEAAYELIEATSPGPRLEMFSRSAREGWDVWGNESASGASPHG